MSLVPSAAGPSCSCGHGPDHHMVSAEPVYDTWGKFWVIFMGVSTAPIRVDLRCRVCKEIIQTLTEPELMKKHL